VYAEDWMLTTSPPIKTSNMSIHLNGMCLLIVDKYSESISGIEQGLTSNALRTEMRELVLDLISTIKEDEPSLPDMDDPKVFRFYFEMYNKEYK
jgi:hypothetical protein